MPDVEWTSRGAQRVIKDFDEVAKATERHENHVKGTTKATQELGRISQKIIKDNETAWERYTRQVVNAKRAHEDNKITVQQLNREHARATIELLRETDAVDKETAARNRSLAVRRQQAKLADVYRLQTLRGVSAMYSETAAVGAMSVQLGNYATAAKRVGGEWSAILGFAGRLAPFIGGAAVLGGIRQSEQASAAAGQRAIASGQAAAGLAELARGDPKKHAELLGVSRASFLEGGFAGGDESGAHALTFELASGDMLAERAFFSKAQRAGQPGAQLAKTVATYRQGFKGGDAVGTSREIVSKAIEAAAEPVGVEAADILKGASLSAANAKRLGLSDEEHLGVISTIADVTADANRAGNYADALYRAFIRRGYVDKGAKPIGQLRDELASKGLVASELQKELGREEASTAFSLISQPGALEQRIGQIGAAQSTGLSDTVFDAAIATPSVATGISVNQRRARTQVRAEEAGLRQERINAQLESQRQRMQEELGSVGAGIVGPFNEYVVSPLTPNVLEDPGTGDLNAPNQMERQAALLEEANRQRARQMRRQAGASNGRAE
jgi:hypothetical protein